MCAFWWNADWMKKSLSSLATLGFSLLRSFSNGDLTDVCRSLFACLWSSGSGFCLQCLYFDIGWLWCMCWIRNISVDHIKVSEHVLLFSLLPKPGVCVCTSLAPLSPLQRPCSTSSTWASGPLMDCLLISSLSSIALMLELCVCVCVAALKLV